MGSVASRPSYTTLVRSLANTTRMAPVFLPATLAFGSPKPSAISTPEGEYATQEAAVSKTLLRSSSPVANVHTRTLRSEPVVTNSILQRNLVDFTAADAEEQTCRIRRQAHALHGQRSIPKPRADVQLPHILQLTIPDLDESVATARNQLALGGEERVHGGGVCLHKALDRGCCAREDIEVSVSRTHDAGAAEEGRAGKKLAFTLQAEYAGTVDEVARFLGPEANVVVTHGHETRGVRTPRHSQHLLQRGVAAGQHCAGGPVVHDETMMSVATDAGQHAAVGGERQGRDASRVPAADRALAHARRRLPHRDQRDSSDVGRSHQGAVGGRGHCRDAARMQVGVRRVSLAVLEVPPLKDASVCGPDADDEVVSGSEARLHAPARVTPIRVAWRVGCWTRRRHELECAVGVGAHQHRRCRREVRGCHVDAGVSKVVNTASLPGIHAEEVAAPAAIGLEPLAVVTEIYPRHRLLVLLAAPEQLVDDGVGTGQGEAFPVGSEPGFQDGFGGVACLVDHAEVRLAEHAKGAFKGHCAAGCRQARCLDQCPRLEIPETQHGVVTDGDELRLDGVEAEAMKLPVVVPTGDGASVYVAAVGCADFIDLAAAGGHEKLGAFGVEADSAHGRLQARPDAHLHVLAAADYAERGAVECVHAAAVRRNDLHAVAAVPHVELAAYGARHHFTAQRRQRDGVFLPGESAEDTRLGNDGVGLGLPEEDVLLAGAHEVVAVVVVQREDALRRGGAGEEQRP
eukprot:scaffold1954_cov268-Pinguiococcus_pyrenoidosus.AAC.245